MIFSYSLPATDMIGWNIYFPKYFLYGRIIFYFIRGFYGKVWFCIYLVWS
jgi:hypothetical protein